MTFRKVPYINIGLHSMCRKKSKGLRFHFLAIVFFSDIRVLGFLCLTFRYEAYNAHFPLQTRRVTHRPCAAWYTSDLRAMKRKKRQAERKFMKSRIEVHKQFVLRSRVLLIIACLKQPNVGTIGKRLKTPILNSFLE